MYAGYVLFVLRVASEENTFAVTQLQPWNVTLARARISTLNTTA
jgi:hypothetical protein